MDLLTNPIKDYPWGSRTAIAELMGRPSSGPEAEMWLGAHPAAPSRLTRDGAETTLAEVVAADPPGVLGAAVAGRFGERLPYLMKVIAVDQPLSLQVHPDAGQAARGHARGDANYTDPWHKPEMVCALTPFTGLAGFRPAEQSAMLVDRLQVDALKPVVTALRGGDVLGALRVLLEWPGARRELVESVVWAASAVHAPDYALVGRLARRYPEDPAVLAPLLMRRHTLAPGEALFLGAGVLHCYLDGLAVEIMACSDNVLRAGLTGKRIDVEELLRITDAAAQPVTVEPADGAYLPPVPEFLLRRIAPGLGPEHGADHGADDGADDGAVLLGAAPRIVLCVEGVIHVGTQAGTQAGTTRDREVKLRPGESVFVAASEGPVEIGGDGVAFCAEPQAGLT